MAKEQVKKVLPEPPDQESGWATKIAKAKEAREEGKKAREGKSAVVQVPRFVRSRSA